MNERATRSAIISNFQSHLIRNTGIQDGDAVVIYYAGHGSRVAPPAQWMLHNAAVELLCPHDERMTVNGELVHGIPDRAINALLHELAAAKGNNIVCAFLCTSSHTRISHPYNRPSSLIPVILADLLASYLPE